MDKDGSLIRKEVQRNTVMISTFMKKNICIAKKIINICIAKTKVNTWIVKKKVNICIAKKKVKIQKSILIIWISHWKLTSRIWRNNNCQIALSSLINLDYISNHHRNHTKISHLTIRFSIPVKNINLINRKLMECQVKILRINPIRKMLVNWMWPIKLQNLKRNLTWRLTLKNRRSNLCHRRTWCLLASYKKSK